jgi:hypothetical protein
MLDIRGSSSVEPLSVLRYDARVSYKHRLRKTRQRLLQRGPVIACLR